MTSPVTLLREHVRTAAFLAEKKAVSEPLPSVLGEIPRGTLTEIAGQASSGRTSLLYSLLAVMTSRQEFCALLDADDRFDPESASAAGVGLSQVLWVRCGGNVEHALKAADMLSQSGGFGLVAIDLGDAPERAVHRIPLAAWFRLRHGVENTRTSLVVLGRKLHARSCSALKIELQSLSLWRRLLNGFEVTAHYTRNHRTEGRAFRIAR